MNSTYLAELIIDDLGLIEHAELQLERGLTILSGETGTGKTLVVTGLQLLSGARADKQSVRADAQKASIQAIFTPPPPASFDWINVEETPDGPVQVDSELIVTREIAADSRSRNRIKIQGQLATAASLQELATAFIELHGQNENLKLTLPEFQRQLLDSWDTSTVEPLQKQYREIYTTWRNARLALRDAKTHATTNAREAQQLEFELQQIEAANIIEDEEIALQANLLVLQHARQIEEVVQEARDVLGSEGGANSNIARATSIFMHSQDVHPEFAQILSRLGGVEAEIADIVEDLRSIHDNLEQDPQVFEDSMERMAELKNLFRMYGPTTQAVLKYQAEATQRLSQVGGGRERIEELQKQVLASKAELTEVGNQLTKARQAVAVNLSDAVNVHLKDLAMPHARLHVVITQAPKPQPHGLDAIEFHVQTNKGSKPAALTRIASGGEKSRIALAIKAAVADIENTPILVFDEVDAGVGGQAATAIGNKLAILAKRCQVICVTHIAQIAAFADTHFVVAKNDTDTRTVTSVTKVANDQRAVELARMLSGTPDSSVALAHADELLASAQADKEAMAKGKAKHE